MIYKVFLRHKTDWTTRMQWEGEAASPEVALQIASTKWPRTSQPFEVISCEAIAMEGNDSNAITT